MRDTGRSHPRHGRVRVALVILALGWGTAGCAGTAGLTTTIGSTGLTAVSLPPVTPVAGRAVDASTLRERAGDSLPTRSTVGGGAEEEEIGDDTDLMPDLTGAHRSEARRLLAGAPVRLLDRSGVDLGDSADFGVVCAQTPPPGAQAGAATATLTVAASAAEC